LDNDGGSSSSLHPNHNIGGPTNRYIQTSKHDRTIRRKHIPTTFDKLHRPYQSVGQEGTPAVNPRILYMILPEDHLNCQQPARNGRVLPPSLMPSRKVPQYRQYENKEEVDTTSTTNRAPARPQQQRKLQHTRGPQPHRKRNEKRRGFRFPKRRAFSNRELEKEEEQRKAGGQKTNNKQSIKVPKTKQNGFIGRDFAPITELLQGMPEDESVLDAAEEIVDVVPSQPSSEASFTSQNDDTNNNDVAYDEIEDTSSPASFPPRRSSPPRRSFQASSTSQNDNTNN